MRLIALLLALLFTIVNCGGGGGVSNGDAPAPTALGTSRPVQYGYYYGCSTYAVEQQGKASLWWATGLCSGGAWPDAIAGDLVAAKAAGMSCAVLHLPDKMVYMGAAGVSTVSQYLHRLAAGGWLAGWKCLALYPGDELDRAGLDDATVTAGNAALREAIVDIPELWNAPFAEFYACATGQTPGFASFKWVGCDDYNARCAVTAAWDGYLARMAPDQVLMAISGGYSGANQDPTCIKAWVSRQSRKVVFIGFTWQATTAGQGIRDNPALRPLYEALGVWALNG